MDASETNHVAALMDAIDSEQAERAYLATERIRRQKYLKHQMREALERNPFDAHVTDRFGRRVIAADLIFADATPDIKHRFLDIAREASNGHDVRYLSQAVLEEIVQNHADKNEPPSSLEWLTLSDFDRSAANEALEKFRANASTPLTTEEFEMAQEDEVSARNVVGLGLMAVAAVAAVGALVLLLPLGQLVSGMAR